MTGKFGGGIELNRDDYLRDISDHLGRMAHQVEVRNSISLFDLNIAAEDFYRGFLNRAYGLNLVNLNAVQPNAKAIDLVDKSERRAFQVTSDTSIGKIRETVRKFEEDGRQADYDFLTMLMLKKKKAYKGLPSPSGYALEVKDHLCLIEDIKNNCEDIQSLKAITEYLEEELVRSPEARSKADDRILDTFADNASRYIAKVAELIVADGVGELPIQDLNNSDLLEKFAKMKCSSSYRHKFDRHAAFFSAVNEIILTDAVDGGAATIRAIVGLIQNIYTEVLDQSLNGDRIHNQIHAALLRNGSCSAEEAIAAETLIFFTINECGIFNE